MIVTSAIAVRPKPSLLRNGLLAFVIAGIPVFGVLIWLGTVHATLPLAIAAVLLCVFCATVCVWRYGQVFIEVEDGVLHESGFATEFKIPVTSISEVVIAETDLSSSAETVAQLLALDANGRRAFRMRGTFWTVEDMHAVADAIGAPIEVETFPMTAKQFYNKYAGAAYWYEGRPWLAILGIALAGGAAFVLVLLMMTIAGGLP